MGICQPEKRQYTTLPILPTLGVLSVSSDFKCAIADNLHYAQSPHRANTTSTIQVHGGTHSITVSWKNGSIFKVLGSQCHYTRCIAAAALLEFMPLSRNSVDQKHTKTSTTLELNINITFQQTCSRKSTNVPIIHLRKL